MAFIKKKISRASAHDPFLFKNFNIDLKWSNLWSNFWPKIHLNVICSYYLLKRSLRENASHPSHPIFCNKTEGQFVAEKVSTGEMLYFCFLSHFEPYWAIFRSRKHIFTIFGRSAVGARRSRGRSAGRSATPDCQPERNPERNSENWAGARLERNSDFCRSANTLAIQECEELSNPRRASERNDIFCILSESAVTDSVIFVSNLCFIDHQNLSLQVGSPSNNS